MKKEIKTTLMATILAVGIVGGTAIAHTGNDTTLPQQSMHGYMTGGGGNMMGMHGQRLHEQGMYGQGMMGSGVVGQGMMTQGRMGFMNMMGHGMGMGMMGGGIMFNMAPEDQQKFMDDTKEMRKKMHTMHFEYMEAMRNPKTSLGDITDMEQKMFDIRKDMIKKAEKYQTKQ